MNTYSSPRHIAKPNVIGCLSFAKGFTILKTQFFKSFYRGFGLSGLSSALVLSVFLSEPLSPNISFLLTLKASFFLSTASFFVGFEGLFSLNFFAIMSFFVGVTSFLLLSNFFFNASLLEVMSDAFFLICDSISFFVLISFVFKIDFD